MHLTFANLTLASSSFCSSELDVIDPEILPESTSLGHTTQKKRREKKELMEKKKNEGRRKEERKGYAR